MHLSVVRAPFQYGRPGVYSGAMPTSAAQGWRSGAPDSLPPDPKEDCRSQLSVMLPPWLHASHFNCKKVLLSTNWTALRCCMRQYQYTLSSGHVLPWTKETGYLGIFMLLIYSFKFRSAFQVTVPQNWNFRHCNVWVWWRWWDNHSHAVAL